MAKRRATAAPIASPAPTSNATSFACDTSISLRGSNPDHLVGNHLVNIAGAVTQVEQHGARMLANARGRACNLRCAALEPGGRLRLPYPADTGLIELGDQLSRHDLLVADDFVAAKDWRTWHIIGIEQLQPLRGRTLRNVFAHLVDARDRIRIPRQLRGKPRILCQL